MQSTTLCSLLVQYEDKYQNDYSYFLDSQTGYPIISSKGWTFAKDYKTSLSMNGERLKFKNRNAYFLFLAHALLREGNEITDEVADVKKLVGRFNKEWTLAQKGKSISFVDENDLKIFFNSKHQTYDWLSNFFFSLIYCEDRKAIFGCVETAYKAYMAASIDDKAFQTLTQSLDPNKAKKIRTPTGELSKQTKLKIMASLIHLKFTQNELLQNWLLQTNQELIEHTDNTFWGDGSNDSFEKGQGENHLGQILMHERDHLKTCSTVQCEDRKESSSKDL